jgi:hypothetical protein
LETFTEPKEFVNNHNYLQQRQASFATLDIDTIDGPIVDIIRGFQNILVKSAEKGTSGCKS